MSLKTKWPYGALGVLQDEWPYGALGVLQDEWPYGALGVLQDEMALRGAWYPTGRKDFYLKPCDFGYIRVRWKFFYEPG